MQRRVRLIVRGSVQGVSFRAYTREMASALGLQGYVKNLANGDVEIVAEGDSRQLDHLIAWARRGPPQAKVEDISIEFSELTNTLQAFKIEY